MVVVVAGNDVITFGSASVALRFVVVGLASTLGVSPGLALALVPVWR